MPVFPDGSIISTAVVAIMVLCGAGHVHAQEDREAAARIGDVVVTMVDVDGAWHRDDAVSRIRILQQLYDTRRRALDIVIGEQLIEREAKARGITRAQLLAAELPRLTLAVTDAEAELVYERNKDRFVGRTLEEMRPEIRTMMDEQRPTQALYAFMRELRMAADDVEILLDPPRQDIETLASDPARGPVDAPVEIVEFSDFECPFCLRVTVTLAELMERHGNQIRLIYKDYPLPSHPHAFKAAEAGNCANEQGRFWEYHDRLFDGQQALGVASLKEYASELGMDPAAFADCLDEGRYAEQVQQDLAIGQRYGVSSTPTLFINGRAVFGAAPLEAFDRIVREELAAAGPQAVGRRRFACRLTTNSLRAARFG